MTTNPHPSDAQLNDPEGQRLVQAIHHRKAERDELALALRQKFPGWMGPAVSYDVADEVIAEIRSSAWFENLVMAEANSYHSGGNCKLCKPSMADAWDEGHEEGFWNGRLSAGMLPSEPGQMPAIGKEHAEANNPYRKDVAKESQEQGPLRRIPTYPKCATCDGGGCGDCA